MGDISAVIPAIQPYAGGAAGTDHGKDYRVVDVERACVNAAKVQLLIVRSLLENDAAEAKKVIAEKDLLCKSYKEYFDMVDDIYADREAVQYQADGTVRLDI